MKGRDALREMLNNKTGDVAAVPPKRTSGAVRAMSSSFSTYPKKRQPLALCDRRSRLASRPLNWRPATSTRRQWQTEFQRIKTLRLKY